MRNQSDASSQHKKAVENAHVQVVLRLLRAERPAVAHQVHETDGHAPVHVENKIILLRRRNGFDRDGVVQHFTAGEALLDEFFDQLDPEIGIVARFHLVPDSRNCLR